MPANVLTRSDLLFHIRALPPEQLQQFCRLLLAGAVVAEVPLDGQSTVASRPRAGHLVLRVIESAARIVSESEEP